MSFLATASAKGTTIVGLNYQNSRVNQGRKSRLGLQLQSQYLLPLRAQNSHVRIPNGTNIFISACDQLIGWWNEWTTLELSLNPLRVKI